MFVCLFSGFANAALINVSDITPSTTFGSYNSSNLINGSGLSGGLHSGDWRTKWLANSATGSLLFDFGSVFNISSSSIWNYGGGCCGINRSVKDLSIEASIDGITFNSIGNFVLSMPVGIPAETIALNTSAQYIKFNLNSNYGDVFIGLSEVQFRGDIEPSTVPEPVSIVLLGLGLAGIGFSRKKKAA